MVEANTAAQIEELNKEEHARRIRMREDLNKMALNRLENRQRLTQISEDTSRNAWVHQDVVDNAIWTVAQGVVQGVTPKRLMAFGYDVDIFFPILADGKAVLNLVSEEAGFKTHHQRMITPWILSNRSVFPTTYHKHSNDLDGAYTLIRSSQGNQQITE